MRDQKAVLRGVHAALRPGGRFVAEMGGLGNIAAIRTALSATMGLHGIDAEEEAASFYPSLEVYSDLLQSTGFSVEQIALVPRPTPLKTGMRQWLVTFRSGVLRRLSQADCEKTLDDMVSLLEPILRDAAGNWWADYVRLRFRALCIQ